MTIAYVPVDVPKVPYSEEIYWDFFNRYKFESEGFWNNVSLKKTTPNLKNGEKSCFLKYDRERKFHWTELALNELPELVDFLDKLPIVTTYIDILENLKDISVHRDLDKKEFNIEGIDQWILEQKGYEPTSYRIMLTNAGRTDSIYVAPDCDVEQAVKIRVPNETDTFVFNSTEYWHGAFLPKQPKLVIFISGFIKPEEHITLLNKSIEKYSEYIISF